MAANYFVLHLYTNFGCWVNEEKEAASVMLHLVVHSQTPMMPKKISVTPPANWNPKILPKVSFTSLKPFILESLPQIKVSNLPGKAVLPGNIMNIFYS